VNAPDFMNPEPRPGLGRARGKDLRAMIGSSHARERRRGPVEGFHRRRLNAPLNPLAHVAPNVANRT
jgi:hypothetical protein